MVRKVVLVTDYDLIHCAQKLGISRNDASQLVDQFRPIYEVSSYDYTLEQFKEDENLPLDEQEYSETERALFFKMFSDLGVTEFTVICD